MRLDRRLRSRRRLVPLLSYQADGSRVRKTDLFRKNPASYLLPDDHSEKTEQSDNRRGRTLNANNSIQHSDK